MPPSSAPEQPPAGHPPAYHAFLVRFWRTSPNARWHASIQRATGEPAMHFAGIDLLFAFLLAQFGDDAPAAWLPDSGDGDAPDATQATNAPD